MLLFPDGGTNVAGRGGSPEHDEQLFDGCDVVVSGTVVSQRMAPCPLEPRSAAAEVGADGRLTAWLSTQTPHQDRDGLAGILGLEPAQVRVSRPTSAAASARRSLSVEEVLVVWLARRLGRPVRWTETRSENMVALSPRPRCAPATSRSAARATARCSPTGSTSCRTAAPTRGSARSCRT